MSDFTTVDICYHSNDSKEKRCFTRQENNKWIMTHYDKKGEWSCEEPNIETEEILVYLLNALRDDENCTIDFC